MEQYPDPHSYPPMSQSTQAAAPGRPTWENERLSLMKEFENFYRHSVQTVQAEHSHVQETLTNQVEQLRAQFQNQIAIHDTRERELSGTLASTRLELEQLKSKSTSPDPLLLGKGSYQSRTSRRSEVPRRSSRATSEPPVTIASAQRITSSTAPKPSNQNRSRSPSPEVPKKSKNQVYRSLKHERPHDSENFIKCLRLHVRILSNTVDNSVLETPSAEQLRDFNRRFSSDEAIRQIDRGSPYIVASRNVQVAKSFRLPGSSVPTRSAGNSMRVEEHHLEIMQGICARYGITQWRPNFGGSAYSNWNGMMRLIFYSTFKILMTSSAYAFLGPNLSFLANTDFILEQYDHFVHHVQKSRFDKNEKAPGSVKAEEFTNATIKARSRLRTARVDFLHKNGYPPELGRILEDARFHSDDELDSETGHYIIKRRPERSDEANEVIRKLEERRQRLAPMTGRRSLARIRVSPALPVDSTFQRVAWNLPVDCYSPDFFNSLSPKLKRQCMLHTLVFPENLDDLFDNECYQISDEHYDIIMDRYKMPRDGDDEQVGRQDGDFIDDAEVDLEGDATMASNDQSASNEDYSVVRGLFIRKYQAQLTARFH